MRLTGKTILFEETYSCFPDCFIKSSICFWRIKTAIIFSSLITNLIISIHVLKTPVVVQLLCKLKTFPVLKLS